MKGIIYRKHKIYNLYISRRTLYQNIIFTMTLNGNPTTVSEYLKEFDAFRKILHNCTI